MPLNVSSTVEKVLSFATFQQILREGVVVFNQINENIPSSQQYTRITECIKKNHFNDYDCTLQIEVEKKQVPIEVRLESAEIKQLSDFCYWKSFQKINFPLLGYTLDVEIDVVWVLSHVGTIFLFCVVKSKLYHEGGKINSIKLRISKKY